MQVSCNTSHCRQDPRRIGAHCRPPYPTQSSRSVARLLKALHDPACFGATSRDSRAAQPKRWRERIRARRNSVLHHRAVAIGDNLHPIVSTTECAFLVGATCRVAHKDRRTQSTGETIKRHPSHKRVQLCVLAASPKPLSFDRLSDIDTSASDYCNCTNYCGSSGQEAATALHIVPEVKVTKLQVFHLRSRARFACFRSARGSKTPPRPTRPRGRWGRSRRRSGSS
jgi:hypothetical protein